MGVGGKGNWFWRGALKGGGGLHGVFSIHSRVQGYAGKQHFSISTLSLFFHLWNLVILSSLGLIC